MSGTDTRKSNFWIRLVAILIASAATLCCVLRVLAPFFLGVFAEYRSYSYLELAALVVIFLASGKIYDWGRNAPDSFDRKRVKPNTIRNLEICSRFLIAVFFLLMIALGYLFFFDSAVTYVLEIVFVVWATIGILVTISNELFCILARPFLETVRKGTLLDARKPIVYLRPFRDEVAFALRKQQLFRYFAGLFLKDAFFLFSRSTLHRPVEQSGFGPAMESGDRQIAQEKFARVFQFVGPYIAIGRPGEGFAAMLTGANKLYIDEENWQRTISHWLQNAAAVIVEVGASPGIAWEIEQVTRTLDPKRVLLITPWRQKDWEAFVAKFQSYFSAPLPQVRPNSRLLIFDDNWGGTELCIPPAFRSWFLAGATVGLFVTLLPFIARLTSDTGEIAELYKQYGVSDSSVRHWKQLLRTRERKVRAALVSGQPWTP